MMEFIKKNKMFVAVLTFIFVVMAAVAVYALSINKPSDIVLPPNLVDEQPPQGNDEEPEDTHERAMIRNFYGQFDDGGNSVILYWDIASNDSVIEKIELYSQNNLIADVTITQSYEMPITVYQFATGVNEFELRCSLKNEVSISEKTSVVVDYIFDFQKSSEWVNDPLLGEGIMISLSYTYNLSTPVGTPIITVKDSSDADSAVEFVANTELSHTNNYVTMQTTYFLPTASLPEGLASWRITWLFDVVQISTEDRISIDIKREDSELPPSDEEDENFEPATEGDTTDD